MVGTSICWILKFPLKGWGQQLMALNEYLVGAIPTSLKNMSSSVGMMTFPYEMENKNV